MNYYLSYLIGAENISNTELADIDAEIIETTPSGSRKLKIPDQNIDQYISLVKK